MSINADYHIHYYMDVCTCPDITLEAIDREAYRRHLDEFGVLAHCSYSHPGKGCQWDTWDLWHTFHPNRLSVFMYDYDRFHSKYGIKTYKGVETELMNSNGDIATPDFILRKLDYVALSLHYFPEMMGNPVKCEAFAMGTNTAEFNKAFSCWKDSLKDETAERVIETAANGYINAIKREPKVKLLAHLDSFNCFSEYGFGSDAIKPETLTEILEPLMKTAAEHNVLWEVTERCPDHILFQRANELGVKFTPTADCHSINGSWGRMSRRTGAKRFLTRNKLNIGRMIL